MTPFRPLPLLGNPHVQTILGNMLPGGAGTLPVKQHTVPLSDGDAIALHETLPDNAGPNAPTVLLLHGLGGCHASRYMVRMTNRLSERGWRVVRMDLRGAGAGVRLARRFYTAACSDDLRVVAERLAKMHPASPLCVVGFSLGANIVLRYAGEFADSLPASLCAVAALAPPLDLVRCSDLLARYRLYDSFYVRHLTRQVAQHWQVHPDVPQIVFPRHTTLRMFDDLYTAPRWGYAGWLDYYQKASALPWVPSVRVRTFILTARDDPFVAVESFETVQAAPCVEIHITDRGGHLGFLGRDGAGGIRWAEAQLTHWLGGQT